MTVRKTTNGTVTTTDPKAASAAPLLDRKKKLINCKILLVSLMEDRVQI